MQTSIPITEFAPAERVPIDVVRREASSFAETPLTADLLNSVLNYVFILNQQRQIVFASHNWRDFLLDRTEEDLLGMRPGEALGCIHSQEKEAGCGTSLFCRECGAVKAILASLAGRPDVQECHLTRLVDCREEALDLLVYGSPFEHKGERFSVVAVADISHEKRRRALERIFFHDVLNSAGGLAGLAQLLDESVPEELHDDMQLLRDGLSEMLEQVQAQKQLAAAENDDLPVEPERLNPAVVLQSVVLLYQKHAVAKNRTLCVAPDLVTTPIWCDPGLLKRVLGNLIKNALEATKHLGIVTTGCEDTEGGVRFWVRNPGGMPESVRLQIFNRSFSTKGPGRGLGTYSVKLLTERYLGGKVGFTTEPKHGTTFHVTIPKAGSRNGAT